MSHEHHFDPSLFWVPHFHCVANDPVVIAMDAAGNIATALAYMLIPMLLMRTVVGMWAVISKPTRSLIVHGAAFIFLCGCTHIMNTVNWWRTYYSLQGWVVMLTGIVSLWFVVKLYLYVRDSKWER